MKKTNPQSPKAKKSLNSELQIQTEKIFEDLEISQRTQAPPSEELIAKLNKIASLPPFSYTQKKKENDLL